MLFNDDAPVVYEGAVTVPLICNLLSSGTPVAVVFCGEGDN